MSKPIRIVSWNKFSWDWKTPFRLGITRVADVYTNGTVSRHSGNTLYYTLGELLTRTVYETETTDFTYEWKVHGNGQPEPAEGTKSFKL